MTRDGAAADRWRGRPVTVMGLGLFGGGAGVARWIAERGARVTVTDLRGAAELAPSLEALADLDITMVLGRHDERDFREAECVVANPAVRPDNRYLALAREAGALVTTELGLFLEHCPVPQIWISGTQGKSSTAHALAQLLEHGDHPVHLAGNMGRSLLAVLEKLDGTAEPEARVVVEVSSYQLECLPEAVARERTTSMVETVVITNLLADHLERHGSIEGYAAAKGRLLEVLRPGGHALLPAGETRLADLVPRDCRVVEHAPGPGAELGIREGQFALGRLELGPVDQLRMPGRFQTANVLPALAAAHLAGVPAPVLAATLSELGGLPHRMEALGTHAGRHVVDNGVSTTPDSTLSALDSIEGGCTLLVGGQIKRGLGFQELAEHAAQRSVRVVTFGYGREQIGESFRRAGIDPAACATLKEAVATALRRTPAGETLLFSPAAASFDSYSNFRQRALAFRAALEHTQVGTGSER